MDVAPVGLEVDTSSLYRVVHCCAQIFVTPKVRTLAVIDAVIVLRSFMVGIKNGAFGSNAPFR